MANETKAEREQREAKERNQTKVEREASERRQQDIKTAEARQSTGREGPEERGQKGAASLEEASCHSGLLDDVDRQRYAE